MYSVIIVTISQQVLLRPSKICPWKYRDKKMEQTKKKRKWNKLPRQNSEKSI